MHLLAEPGDIELFVDFDGTLAAICDDPADAEMSATMWSALQGLVSQLRRVSVVSGRPVSFLADRVPADIDLFGLYGLEWQVDGMVGEAEGTAVWREVVSAAVAEGTQRFGTDVVEDKGASLTAHFRRRPELEEAVVAWVDETAVSSGLVMRSAKMSCELHPPVEVDKGSVLLDQALAPTVIFMGDDIGDLPAFEALRVLRERGTETVGVVARTDETPVEVLEIADVAVDGTAGVWGLLERLASGSELVD